MQYAEAAYFDGNHCAHCAAREEHKRLRRKDLIAQQFLRRKVERRHVR